MLDPNTYSPNDGNNPSTDSSAVSKGASQSSRTFLSKVFLYFGIQLLFTALLTFGLAYLFDYIFPFAGGSSSGTIFYIVMLIVSSIGMIVSLIVINKKVLVNRKGGIVSLLFYSFFNALLFATLSFYIGDKNIIAMAFLITSVTFIIMCLFGLMIKKAYGWLIGVALGLLFGAGIIYLINTFLLPFILFGNSDLIDTYLSMYYIAEWCVLIYASIITIIDVFRIKKLSQNENLDNSLALYSSLMLYQDFIMILIRIVYILLASKSRND